MIDIRLYVHKEKKYNSFIEKHQNIHDAQYYDHLNVNLNHVSIPVASIIKLHKQRHHYCLNKGRHCGNFYLKIGAAGNCFVIKNVSIKPIMFSFLVFCLGHLVHSGLLLGYQLVFFGTDAEDFFKCAQVTSLILDTLYPLYSFFILYFIFKYSNVSIHFIYIIQ